MTHYLVQIRFFGRAKKEIKNIIKELDREFGTLKHRPVPHITLLGPFYTKNQDRLVSDFKKVCEVKENLMNFKVRGYDTFEDNNVVYADIRPDEKLRNFRKTLADELKSYCNLKDRDLKEKYELHSTLANHLPSRKFRKVKKYLEDKPDLDFDHIVIRVTLLRNKKILKEYDFMLNKLLDRRKAKSGKTLNKSFNQLEEHLEHPEKPISEIDLEKDLNINLEEPDSLPKKIWRRIKGRKRAFFTADLHLHHKNIIKYCNRPFDSVKEMNETLVDNWNKKVNDTDIVFYLGDLTWYKNLHKYLKRLNGKIHFIKGNHEKEGQIDFFSFEETNFYNKLILKYKERRFLLVHNPEDVPEDWDEWVIHAHHHNNDTERYPLVNYENKTVNVSTEMTDYEPISFKKILEKINTSHYDEFELV